MASLTFPYKLVPLEESVQKEVQKRFLAYSGGLVKVEGSGFIMPSHYQKFTHKYYNYKFLKDDVVVMTHPKCGTAWVQEIVWTMRSGCQFNTDLELGVRSPFLEFDSLEHPDLKPLDEWVEGFRARHPGKDPQEEGLYLDLTNTTPSPRTIKTHLPFSLLTPSLIDTNKVVYIANPKDVCACPNNTTNDSTEDIITSAKEVVYVARNPKDVIVSYYHHQRLVKVTEFIGDFPEFLDYFCRDLITQGPFWYHIGEAWERRNHPNVLLLFYEDLKTDPLPELRRLNGFLQTGLTEGQLEKVAQHASFQNMKGKATTNPTQAAIKVGRFKEGEGEFVRKGVTGDWVNYFTPDLEKKFQDWVKRWSHVSDLVPFKYTV